MKPIPSKLKSLNQVTRELVQCQSIEELINKSLNAVCKNLKPQVASIFLFNKDGVIQRVGIEGIDKNREEIDNTWFPEENYQPGESFSGKPVPRVDEDSGYGEPNYSNDLENCFPLVIQDECFGTISIYTSYQRKFYSNDDKFLNNVAYLTAAITARVSILEKYRKVQRDLNDAREKLLNASMLVSYDSLLRGFLHQYKNELIELRQTLDTLAGETNQKKRDTIIKSKDSWLEQRIQEIQASFKKSYPVPVEINQLIQDAANLFLEHTNIEIEEKYDQTIPIILIEKEKIESVIYNLISNAVIAVNKSKKKDGKIIIETNIINIDGMQHIQIIIEDNGIGIPNENAEKIFQEGFTTRPQEGGTGMGLYVSRIIINDHGGKIVFSSRIGKGTKFFVRIPLELYQI